MIERLTRQAGFAAAAAAGLAQVPVATNELRRRHYCEATTSCGALAGERGACARPCPSGSGDPKAPVLVSRASGRWSTGEPASTEQPAAGRKGTSEGGMRRSLVRSATTGGPQCWWCRARAGRGGAGAGGCLAGENERRTCEPWAKRAGTRRRWAGGRIQT